MHIAAAFQLHFLLFCPWNLQGGVSLRERSFCTSAQEVACSFEWAEGALLRLCYVLVV